MTSMWTKKVAAPITAVATAAAFFAVGGASVASAASNGLTVHQARHLAHKLVVKQRRERSLVFTHLGKPIRRSPSRIDFRYEDRSTADVLCRARIVVRQTSGERHADLVGAKCHGIPSDVLGYEAATRRLIKSFPDYAKRVSRSMGRYDRGVADCDYISVPRDRADEVDLLFDLGFTYAFYKPLRTRLGSFAEALHDVHPSDPDLVAGMESWDNFLILFDELDPATQDPCAAVKEWAANDFSDESAPADFSELRVERQELRDEARRLRRVAKHLADAGAVRRTAIRFSPTGIADFFLKGSTGAPGA
jgi:hypothetical protein